MVGTAPIDRTVGAQLRLARLTRGLSLRGLARQLEVSPATLSQIENGRTDLSLGRLHHIVDGLGMTVPELLEHELDTSPAGSAGEPGSVPASTLTPVSVDRSVSVADWRTYQPLQLDPVLEAALDAFVTIGYYGSTVRDIAARCGLSVSGLYHYYASKQRMLMTLLELTMNELLARARLARDEGEDPVERFSLLIEHLALFHTHRLELGFIGASEMRSLEASNREKIAALRQEQQHMVDTEVQAAVDSGRFRTTHLHEAARAAVTMCTALPTWWRRDGQFSPEQIAEQYVGFALDLLAASSARARSHE